MNTRLRVPVPGIIIAATVFGALVWSGLSGTAREKTSQNTHASRLLPTKEPTALGEDNAAGAREPLPFERLTAWNPGLMSAGGIPHRTIMCAQLTPLGNGLDDTAQIQKAIASCPAGRVIQLAAGHYLLNSSHILINKGVTLRGAGPGRTILAKTTGARPFPLKPAGDRPGALVIVGPAVFLNSPDGSGAVNSRSLLGNAVKGEYAVQVSDTTGLSAGQFVLLDEKSGASWQDIPHSRGRVWAAPDWRVVWRKHDPPNEDDFTPDVYPTTPGSAGGWFSRLDRPTAEIKQIADVSERTVTFTTPVHITYRADHAAQLSPFATHYVTHAGIEDLTLTGGDSGNLRFRWAAFSWAKNVESTVSIGDAIGIESSFGIEIREFYAHNTAWAQPGGGGYLLSLAFASSEILIENGIAVKSNKPIVVRSAGAGSVVGYNYMDMSYINYHPHWIEVGINASHMVGSHHVLFEGNYSHNADSDDTHGNSIYLTFFRNYLRGVRPPFDNQAGGRIDDVLQARNGPKRAVGLMTYSYWMSFLGNVLGAPNEMRGWVYETWYGGPPGVWMLGWGRVTDPRVKETSIRHGNFDYLTNSVRWEVNLGRHDLPSSLYLKARPPFFDEGRKYAWPWVNPLEEVKLKELPAKVRFDAGTPFNQP
jgi:hypothetical protein